MGKKTDILNDFFASDEGQKALKPDKKALHALKKKKALPPSPALALQQEEIQKKKSKKKRAAAKKSGRTSFSLNSVGDMAISGNIDALQETRIAASPSALANSIAAAAASSGKAPLSLSAEAEKAAQAGKYKAPVSSSPPPAKRPVNRPKAAPPPPPPLQQPPKNSPAPILSPHVQMSRLRSGGAAGGVNEGGSPFQLNLIQSESLRLAQNKIADLEEELENQRRDNEKLSSGAGLLEESLERLRAENEELRSEKENIAQDFADEKDVLLTAMEEGKKNIIKLQKTKKHLERRLSGDLQGVRARESALESKIEIMKIENSVVQKEKDKIIIDMKKEAAQRKENLSAAQADVQKLKSRLSRVNENLRRTVSVLRATVNNLAAGRQEEEDEEREREREGEGEGEEKGAA